MNEIRHPKFVDDSAPSEPTQVQLNQLENWLYQKMTAVPVAKNKFHASHLMEMIERRCAVGNAWEGRAYTPEHLQTAMASVALRLAVENP
jgi:hypothetical protein